MKKSKSFLFILFFMISKSLLAQDGLTGFLIGGDTSYIPLKQHIQFTAFVFQDGVPEYDYSVSWSSDPEGYILPSGVTDNTTLAEEGSEFDIYATIEVNGGDVLQLKQHVVIQQNLNIFIGNYRNLNYAFTDTEKSLYVIFTDYQKMDDLGYRVSVSGEGAQFIVEETQGDIATFRFNCPVAGEYDISFTLEDQEGNSYTGVEETIQVFDKADQGILTFKTNNVLGENFHRSFIIPASVPIDSIQWHTNDPSSPYFGEEWKKDTTDYAAYSSDNEDFVHYLGEYEGSFLETGTFFRSVRIFYADSRIITLNKEYIVTRDLTISAAIKQACVGDTVSVPFTFQTLKEENRIEGLNIIVNYDREKLLPVGLENGINTGELNLTGDQNNPLVFATRLGTNDYYKPDDTICTVDFLVKEQGEHQITPQPISIKFSSHSGEIRTTNAEFNVQRIPGMSRLFELHPANSDANDRHYWTYGANSDKSSKEVSPVISHSDENQKVCLEVRGGDVCLSENCVTIAGNTLESYSISGVLENNSGEEISGEVVAYYIREGKYYPAGKDVASVNGSFTINDLEKGDYILLGIPENDEYNAAYYYYEGIRDQSVILPVDGNVTDINLTLPGKHASSGELISGGFEKDNLTISHKNIFEKFYGELPSVVFLTDKYGEIVDWTVLDENNDYSLINYSQETELKASYGRISDELINHHNITSVSARETDSDLIVYPNPFQSKIIIEVSREGIYVECINLQGKNVFGKDLQKGKNILNTSKLATGVYTFLLRGDSFQEAVRVVKD